VLVVNMIIRVRYGISFVVDKHGVYQSQSAYYEGKTKLPQLPHRLGSRWSGYSVDTTPPSYNVAL